MTFDDMMAEIAQLIRETQGQPQDRHELYLKLRGKLNEMRAVGMPLPDDLLRFERELEGEFARDQNEKSRPEH